MFCSNCGKEIPSGAAFCPNCGAKVSAPEPPGSAYPPPADSAGESSAGPVAEPHPSKTPMATASPLEAVIGKSVPYYMEEFRKIEAGQKPRFNWAAFFFGPYLCFYRRCFALFKRYFLLSYILLFSACLIALFGLIWLDVTVLLVCGVVILAAGILTLVNSIRLGHNFNREYYRHCQQQLAKPEGVRKTGVSIKNVLVFALGLVLVYGLCGALLMPSSMEDVRAGYYDEAARTYAERAASSGDDNTFSAGANSGSSVYHSESLGDSSSVSSSQADEGGPLYINLSPLPADVYAGTYQVIIGRSGLISSIRVFENPDDPQNPWYCDVISWSVGGDRDLDITDDYYGPAYISGNTREITCGDWTFFFDESGAPAFDYTLGELSYGIERYSSSATPEDGLNALIDQVNDMDVLTIPQSAINHYIETYSLDPSSVIPLAAYQSTSERIRYSVFSPAYYSYEYYGPRDELNPNNPNHVYTIADDGWKSDAELSDREFEQRHGLYYGYCDDFGRDTTGKIPTDPT